ncbi:MAG: NAD-dependent deacetylase [Gammaproteobacteria bacterium]|nr:MAG: NAD-dependent deacetylase [Gammaproteobacteria bacterium]
MEIIQIKEIIEDADAILIGAGAGMGVDSGLPDFRGNRGFWKAYPAIEKLGYSFSEMANPRWFHENPRLAWGFYGHRLNLYRDTKPHDGFYQILKYAERKQGGVFVFTSNVDGQFQKAGFTENTIVECHGSIHHVQCLRGCSEIISANTIDVKVDMTTFLANEPLPKCRACGALLRPNILMFGDWEWDGERTDIQNRNFEEWLDANKDSNIVILEFGAGKAVPTVRYMCERIAGDFNASLVRVNPRDADGPSCTLGIELGALAFFEELNKY